MVLPFAEMPSGDEMLAILRHERAPLKVWNKTAVRKIVTMSEM